MLSKRFIDILILIHYTYITSGENKVGVVFSPLIRKGDRHNTESYTTDMVKEMLKVIHDAGFASVTTYGVGASFIHTAVAAASLNLDMQSLGLTVYQGLYNSTYVDQVNLEIENGLKAAVEANNVFHGTVPAIIFPSLVPFNDLIDNTFVYNKMGNASEQTRNLKMRFGVRVPDCQNIPTRDWRKVRKVAVHLDFIICLATPDESRFRFGTKSFKSSEILVFLQAEEYLYNTVWRLSNDSSHSVEFMMEIGWPGDEALQPPNSIRDLTSFWTIMTDWSRENSRRLFLHEAFDNPWKDQHPEWPLAAHFGYWQYNESEPNLLSKTAYIRKWGIGADSTGSSFLETFTFTHVGIILAGVALLGFGAVLVLMYKRVNRIEKATALISDLELKMFFEGHVNDGLEEEDEFQGEIWEKSAYDMDLELKKSQIKIDKTGLLGKGQFGCVYKGELYPGAGANSYDAENSIKVAIKMARSSSFKNSGGLQQSNAEQEIKSILCEIKMLAYIGVHENICGILGAYTQEIAKGVVYFVLQMCELGNLLNYLQKYREQFERDLGKSSDEAQTRVENDYVRPDVILLSESQLIRWCFEIASGMAHISFKHVVHSDLAARNVLLHSDYTTKITDFGLSRRLLDEDLNYDKKGNEPLPWKWMAPESLEFRRFSPKSDVWSYGVTLWEILSLGAPPRYPNVHAWNELVPCLKSGVRLQQPEFAPPTIYDEIMSNCWKMEADTRPSFDSIKESLVSLINVDYM